MKKRKLNYKFHNPNPLDITADYILGIFFEANKAKVENAIEEEIKRLEKDTTYNRQG